MNAAEQALGEQLSKTSLRDFKPIEPSFDHNYELPTYTRTVPSQAAPIPVLLRHALTLTGIDHTGPGEKFAWWMHFFYKGFPCSLAHQKFGLRLRLRGDVTDAEAQALLIEMQQKLISAVTRVEKLLAGSSQDILNSGNVTVLNQHNQLRRAYRYFRERALNPEMVEDVEDSGKSEYGGTWRSFSSGQDVMARNSFHDLVAAISAFISVLEHELVLALPFLGFDPATDSLTSIIGDNWGKKWRRVVGVSDPESVRLRERLAAVVERWRNPYSHGGFEKGHGATIYVHTPGLGALPVGLSQIRDSPLFTFHPATESDIQETFDLFDDVDLYLSETLPHATEWIRSGLEVRFDATFVSELARAIDSDGDLERLIEAYSEHVDMLANMDY